LGRKLLRHEIALPTLNSLAQIFRLGVKLEKKIHCLELQGLLT